METYKIILIFVFYKNPSIIKAKIEFLNNIIELNCVNVLIE